MTEQTINVRMGSIVKMVDMIISASSHEGISIDKLEQDILIPLFSDLTSAYEKLCKIVGVPNGNNAKLNYLSRLSSRKVYTIGFTTESIKTELIKREFDLLIEKNIKMSSHIEEEFDINPEEAMFYHVSNNINETQLDRNMKKLIKHNVFRVRGFKDEISLVKRTETSFRVKVLSTEHYGMRRDWIVQRMSNHDNIIPEDFYYLNPEGQLWIREQTGKSYPLSPMKFNKLFLMDSCLILQRRNITYEYNFDKLSFTNISEKIDVMECLYNMCMYEKHSKVYTCSIKNKIDNITKVDFSEEHVREFGKLQTFDRKKYDRGTYVKGPRYTFIILYKFKEIYEFETFNVIPYGNPYLNMFSLDLGSNDHHDFFLDRDGRLFEDGKNDPINECTTTLIGYDSFVSVV